MRRAVKGESAAIVSAQEKRVTFSQMSVEQKRVFGTPSGFGRHFLKIPLTDKQAQIADAFLPNRAHVSAVTCNEAGKTTKVMAAVVLWHLAVFPRRGENGGVTATSGSWAQIKNQLMPALRSHEGTFRRLPGNWRFLDTEIQRDGEPAFMAYSCTQPGRAEGFHGSAETPLLMLFDECKSVADDIIRAGEDRCRPQRLGLLSSPGFAMGKFYASQTTEAAYWKCHKLTVDDCPWIDRVEMRRVIERAGGGDYERGLQDPFIRSAYFAEFMPFVADSLITLPEIEACLTDPPGQKGNDRHGFCDFAAGGDENALSIKVGNRVKIEDAWRDKDPMRAVGRFIQHFVRLRNMIGMRAEEIEGDADGLGGPMVARMAELGWPILPYHADSSPIEKPDRFYNRASENWYEGCQKIKQRLVIIDDDADLKGQLVDRCAPPHSSGLIKLESKKDLFRRQAQDGRPSRSPDRAEAVLNALGRLPRLDSMQAEGERERNPYEGWGPYIGEGTGAEPSIPEEVLRGFNAGG